jgi:hypothetical protein
MKLSNKGTLWQKDKLPVSQEMYYSIKEKNVSVMRNL